MRMSRTLSALLVLMLVLSSCGGSDSSKETTTPQESQTEQTQTTDTVEETPASETVEETPEPETVEETPEPETTEVIPELATPELQQTIETALEDWIAANGAPGSSLAVLLPDGSEILTAAGVRDLRAEGAATTEDYWRIASISKPITSAVVLRLVEQGLVDVEATVATYLGDEWATGYELGGVDYAPLITIRQILDHTDGFREYAFDPGFYIMVNDRLDVPMDPQEVVDWEIGRAHV